MATTKKVQETEPGKSVLFQIEELYEDYKAAEFYAHEAGKMVKRLEELTQTGAADIFPVVTTEADIAANDAIVEGYTKAFEILNSQAFKCRTAKSDIFQKLVNLIPAENVYFLLPKCKKYLKKFADKTGYVKAYRLDVFDTIPD